MLVLPLLALLFTPRPQSYPLPSFQSATKTEPAAEAPAPAPVRPARHVRRPEADAPAEAAGPVTGVVLDPDGHPVPQASVRCTDRGEDLAVSADEEGRFQLPETAAGCLAVARHATFNETEPVALVAGRANTLRFNRGGRIEGDVIDEHGAPVTSYLLGIESYRGAATSNVRTGRDEGRPRPAGRLLGRAARPRELRAHRQRRGSSPGAQQPGRGRDRPHLGPRAHHAAPRRDAQRAHPRRLHAEADRRRGGLAQRLHRDAGAGHPPGALRRSGRLHAGGRAGRAVLGPRHARGLPSPHRPRPHHPRGRHPATGHRAEAGRRRRPHRGGLRRDRRLPRARGARA